MKILTYTSTPFVFKNSESESSTNLHTYFTKWEEKDLNEFTMLVEKSEKTWKPAKELEVINIGSKQDRKYLKIGTFHYD